MDSLSLSLSPPQTTGWSALMLAAINNQKEVVTLLLQHGAKKEHRDVSKRTAVQLATVLGHREAALALDDKKIGEPKTSATHKLYFKVSRLSWFSHLFPDLLN